LFETAVDSPLTVIAALPKQLIGAGSLVLIYSFIETKKYLKVYVKF